MADAGDTFKIFLASYLLFRFAAEFIKPPFGTLHSALENNVTRIDLYANTVTGIQIACLLGLTYYLLIAARRARNPSWAKVRPYLFYDTATSICGTCMRRIEAKILIKDQNVYMDKWCPTHGIERVLIADDADYYRSAREVFIKPPEMPQHFATPMRYGCPYDCGLCPDHMQHSCLAIIEITDHCNLSCPVCYADSGPHRPEFKSLATIEHMLDVLVASEGTPDVLQISGGEPTLHPDFFAILDAARRRPIRHLMVNTNGLRIARDPEFVDRLASYAPGFEIYLQFDSRRDEVHQVLRGASLSRIREQALEQLNRVNLSTTLVVT